MLELDIFEVFTKELTLTYEEMLLPLTCLPLTINHDIDHFADSLVSSSGSIRGTR